MILVTGAAGKTGLALMRALAGRSVRVRALVRRSEQQQSLLAAGAHEVVVGDLRNRDHLLEAHRGVQTVYHICPNMQPDEVEIARLVLAAAQANGVERIVYHSVLHPGVEEMPHHWLKLRVEELLFKSGLAYTILQPAVYMQNVFASWSTIVQEGRYRAPYAVETQLGMVDLLDVAEAAARVLVEPGHAGAIYELAGAEVLSQTEVAAILTECLGRAVRAEVVNREVWAQGVRAAGLSDYAVETLQKMFVYYERYGFAGNPHVLSGLLGRPPASLRVVVERQKMSDVRRFA